MWREERDDGAKLSREIRIKGDLRGAEDLVLEARIEGRIELEGALTLKPASIVKGEVFADRVKVAGTVVGNISATESIELEKGARVLGDLRAPNVRIVEGARFSGELVVGPVSRADVVELSSRLAEKDEPRRARRRA